ncbi:circularly permuted type 2 ATP-grasp protein [Roseomonas aerophila]|uniref:Circularly permuted type 2 ATP-grasp protein n=2 Tax=Teichococcus aerophilus TaxID=1224513 RepID=A0ABR7RJS8_9PROT|nr:circularly permuted type 2 ATP-grasp protein [Pseudoroseomonas aerophila]
MNMHTPRDEMVDGNGRVRPHWRGVLAGFADLPPGGIEACARRMERAFEDEGVTSLLPGEAPAAGQASWRCDPVPLVLPADEFAALSAGLAQRARLLEALLADLYGPQALLAEGLIPPALVFNNPGFLRPCRDASQGWVRHPFLHCYAADLLRGPDGLWRVVADRTSRAGGIGHAQENRRMLGRVLPAAFRGYQVRPLRPFFDVWQDALQRLAPPRDADGSGDGPAIALLTPGVNHRLWFEHVLLARELSCALVEPNDLSVRNGAVFVKTLKGLQPVDVLLRRVAGPGLDPLEFDHAVGGVPGLLDAARHGTVKLANEPGGGVVEAAGLTALLPALCRRLLGEDLLLPQAETLWLADPLALGRVLDDLTGWIIRPATGRGRSQVPALMDLAERAELAARIEARPADYAASAAVPSSVAPCVVGDRLAPRPVRLRMFLMQDGARWHTLPGGLARVEDADGTTAKDVWVLNEEDSRITGPVAQPQQPLSIRRSAGDLPSRAADNLFWLGRYVERLEGAARLIRATLTRLDRGPLLPREVAELQALAQCLSHCGLAAVEDQPSGGATAALRAALLRSVAEGGVVAGLFAQVARLIGSVRDRLTADMYATFTLPLRGLRAVASQARELEALEAAMGGVLRYTASVAGVAAENMVRAGGYTFLDLGRRVERAQSVAAQLHFALAQPPSRIEGGLRLALELCDSVITYRSRYLGVLQPAPALDLVLADPGNPRGLGFQLHALHRLLTELAEGTQSDLADAAARLISEVEAMPGIVLSSQDGQAAATGALSPSLGRIEDEVASLSDAVTRRYFALLPLAQALGGQSDGEALDGNGVAEGLPADLPAFV